MINILSISGSDNSGFTGLQQDLCVITELGAHALTVASCIVIQDEKQIREVLEFPLDLLQKQLAHLREDFHPRAVKVGLLSNASAVKAVAREIDGCRNLVVAPGIVSSSGSQLVDDGTLLAIKQYLIPRATLLMLRCMEAERMLEMKIATSQDMCLAAQQFLELGARHIMLRGGKVTEGRITALLAQEGEQHFFSSYNTDGWQRHGVGGALSAAITTRLGLGDDVPTAIRNAHQYVHSHLVYSVQTDPRKLRPSDLYNTFISLISLHYQQAHDVAFYAEQLHISPRYLSQITRDTIQQSPKQILGNYLFEEAKRQLENSRLSIKEISQILGFSTTTRFCKFFKQLAQQTPSKYRLSAESLS